MKETHRVFLSHKLEGRITNEGLNTSRWFQQALKLGFLVEKGKVFQSVGNDFLRLEMRDFQPYPTASRRQVETQLRFFTLPKAVVVEIEKASQLEVNDWINRALNLRVMFERLRLRVRVDGDYVPILLRKTA